MENSRRINYLAATQKLTLELFVVYSKHPSKDMLVLDIGVDFSKKHCGRQSIFRNHQLITYIYIYIHTYMNVQIFL